MGLGQALLALTRTAGHEGSARNSPSGGGGEEGLAASPVHLGPGCDARRAPGHRLDDRGPLQLFCAVLAWRR